MDPNENLREALAVARDILNAWDQADDVLGELPHALKAEVAEKAERLAELVEGLDGWLSRGGFLPAAWERNRPKGRVSGNR